MIEEVEAYIDFLSRFNEVNRPISPQYDYFAFADKKYVEAIDGIMRDYELIDDFYLTIKHIKGD